MTINQLQAEVMKLRTAIRNHRDSSGHDLCWYVPELWTTLPEQPETKIEVPPPCEFVENCMKYRLSLEDKSQIDKAVEKINAFLATGEGMASWKAAAAKAHQEADDMIKRTQISEETLRKRVNYRG